MSIYKQRMVCDLSCRNVDSDGGDTLFVDSHELALAIFGHLHRFRTICSQVMLASTKTGFQRVPESYIIVLLQRCFRPGSTEICVTCK